MVAVLLDNVGEKYSQFVHRIVASRDEIPDFDKVVAMLYEEDRLLKSDNTNIAMAAAMKRYKKELEDKKSSGKGNNNNTNSGRGGNNNTNNNSGDDRHSKNPNNVNYKGEGDPPECSKCTPNVNGKLKKHWPFDCWTLHEDRMPEKFRNNKPKANKATERADDFVDSNGTHFSAMAMSAPFELGMEGDDEYWGWSVIDTAPKGYREVITEEPNTQSLDESLAHLIENREISENDSNIEASLLIPGRNFGCEESGGAHGGLTSQHTSHEVSPVTSPTNFSTPNSQAYAAALELPSHRSPDWLIYLGSTNHMYHDKEEFIDYQPYRAGITIADGTILSAEGRGTLQHEWIVDDGSSHIVDIKDVLHVPNLTCGLFSLNQATRNSLKITFQGEGCYIYKEDMIIGTAPKVNNVYVLSITQSSTKVAMLI